MHKNYFGVNEKLLVHKKYLKNARVFFLKLTLGFFRAHGEKRVKIKDPWHIFLEFFNLQ